MKLLFLPFFLSTLLFSQTLTNEEAFKANISQYENGVEVSISIGENIFLYEEEIDISLVKPELKSLNPFINFPNPEKFDNYLVYFDEFKALVPWSVLSKLGVEKGDFFEVKLSWQGCSKQGFCYQPMNYNVGFNEIGKNSTTLSEHDAIAQNLLEKGFLWVIVSFFGFGLLLSLTPCLFPMIPILSSIIVSHGGEKLGSKKGFFLALTYVLSMAIAYTIVGVLAGLFGANMQALFQVPWIIWLFSLVFVALSLSMFGFYELQMPSFITKKLSFASDKKDGIVGVAIMGFLSALIVGPCVAAPLAGALLYIGQSGDALLGGVALFVMSLGMGLPLLLIGASAGKLLPKPGPWMDATKAFFGITLLALAIWMLDRVIPSHISLMLYGVLALFTSVYMGVLERAKEGGWWRFLKGVALLILIYGIFLIAGGVAKGENPLNPLEPFSLKAEFVQKDSLGFEYISSVKELEERVKKSKKPVMVDFYASWCVSCKELENITFKDEIVSRKLNEMELLKVDVTKNSSDDKELLKKFNLFGPPGLIFYKGGEELKELQIVGFIKAKEFSAHLERVLKE